MPGNKHVYTLDLENNQLLTDTGLEALRLVLPRCCVERMRLEDTAVTALQQAQLETSLAANRSRNIAVALVRPHQRLRLAALFERERLVPERSICCFDDEEKVGFLPTCVQLHGLVFSKLQSVETDLSDHIRHRIYCNWPTNLLQLANDTPDRHGLVQGPARQQPPRQPRQRRDLSRCWCQSSTAGVPSAPYSPSSRRTSRSAAVAAPAPATLGTRSCRTAHRRRSPWRFSTR